MVGKIRGDLKKEVSPIFTLTNPFRCYLSLCVWCVGVCFAHVNHFYQYSLFFRKNVFLLNLISKHVTFILQVRDFWRAKTLRTSVKQFFEIIKLLIQCNTDSCYEHKGGVDIYLYMCQSTALCLCLFVCVCDIESEY